MRHNEKPPAERRVLVVDDHPIMRTGLRQLIDQEPDLTVCGEAEDAHGALEAIERHKPQIVLVDISLKDRSGIELIKDIRVRWPDVPVLVLSMHEESFYAERALRAGARGYVTKSQASAKVVEGIRRVLDGEVYFSEQVVSMMLGKMAGGGQAAEPLVDSLSDREFEVFELIGQGLPTRDIAARLHLSIKTIEAHRENIKRKLKLATATDLLRYAVQWVEFERRQ
jgi:DNA-binding NarL/FixJ family response regulator